MAQLAVCRTGEWDTRHDELFTLLPNYEATRAPKSGSLDKIQGCDRKAIRTSLPNHLESVKADMAKGEQQHSIRKDKIDL